VEPPAPHPTRKLAIENDRLRLRIEALERLAAESREAEEARRESEERSLFVGTLSLWSGERPYSRADEELITAVGALLAMRLSRSNGR
jgi:septal ring factor EnvC (AmiA/AmiB activator)